MAFTTTDLLTRIRLKARLSGSEIDYTSDVLLDLADQVMVDHIVPAILGTNGDYYLIYEDAYLTAGRSTYPIPTRSYQNKIHSIHILNSDKTSKNVISYGTYQDLDINVNGMPVKHTINDDKIILYDAPATTGEYMRVYYYYTPSLLVESNLEDPACMLITGGISTGVLTGDVPAGWTTSDKYDIVAAQSPFSLVAVDLTPIAIIPGTSISFELSSLDTDRLSSGTYYVTKSQETLFPMIPRELHYVLADLVACAVLSNIGDESWQQSFATSIAKLNNLIKAIISRKTTENKPWVRRNSSLRYRV